MTPVGRGRPRPVFRGNRSRIFSGPRRRVRKPARRGRRSSPALRRRPPAPESGLDLPASTGRSTPSPPRSGPAGNAPWPPGGRKPFRAKAIRNRRSCLSGKGRARRGRPGAAVCRPGRPAADQDHRGHGVERSEVFIANVVKCRPPENRVPHREEAEACAPFLIEQISILRPRVIVALGKRPSTFSCRTSRPWARSGAYSRNGTAFPSCPRSIRPTSSGTRETGRSSGWSGTTCRR